MMPNFALEDPEIFNSVLPWSMVTQETTSNAVKGMPRNSAKLLQEKVGNNKILLDFWYSSVYPKYLINSKLVNNPCNWLLLVHENLVMKRNHRSI